MGYAPRRSTSIPRADHHARFRPPVAARTAATKRSAHHHHRAPVHPSWSPQGREVGVAEAAWNTESRWSRESSHAPTGRGEPTSYQIDSTEERQCDPRLWEHRRSSRSPCLPCGDGQIRPATAPRRRSCPCSRHHVRSHPARRRAQEAALASAVASCCRSSAVRAAWQGPRRWCRGH